MKHFRSADRGGIMQGPEVEAVDRPGKPYLSTGEAGQEPAVAAAANAAADAIGARLRELPFTPDRVKAGLQAQAPAKGLPAHAAFAPPGDGTGPLSPSAGTVMNQSHG